MKTTTNGYYTFKVDKKDRVLHFSMNTWYNLKEDTGRDLSEYGKLLDSGSDIEKAFALSEIIFAAAKAYDQEEGIDIDYNIYKVRSWFGSEIGAKEIEGITEALLWNNDTGAKEAGKSKGK